MTDDALRALTQAIWKKELLRMFDEHRAAQRVAERIESGQPLFYGTLRPMSYDAPIKTAEEEKSMGELKEKLSDQNLIKKARDAAVDWCDGLGAANLGPLLVRLADALEAARARELTLKATLAGMDDARGKCPVAKREGWKDERCARCGATARDQCALAVAAFCEFERVARATLGDGR